MKLVVIIIMFFELSNNSNFKKTYFDTLKYRLSFASLELEGISDDLADTSQSVKIFNQLSAINFVFDNHKDGELLHYEFTNLLCNIVEKVTGAEINNFRTINVYVNGSNVKRSEPQMIRNDLWYLIDNYNYRIKNCKSEQEFFEIEAEFHIRLLHIHPFEDGNGRMARILLAYNMCKHSIAPCIITKEIKKEYCDYIEQSDLKKLAKLFAELSKKELDTMIALYKELDEKGLIESNKMTDEQEREYRRITNSK